MPGSFDVESRIITLQSDFRVDPVLTLATLNHFAMDALLEESGLSLASYPEIIELAVVATGLGAARSHVSLVKESGSFWDTTQWEAVPRPFLDPDSLAYANALAAWIRGQSASEWFQDLPNDLRRRVQKSLKYLQTTDDCFLTDSVFSAPRLSQDDCWRLLASASASQQVIALREIEPQSEISPDRLSLLRDRLRSNDRDVLLHAIDAVRRWSEPDSETIGELGELIDSRDDEIRAKAMTVLVRYETNPRTIETATRMLGSPQRFVVFAGSLAIASLDRISEETLRHVDRAFRKSLQACDYEFISLFAAAYNRWMDKPRAYVQQILEDSPEYISIANQAFDELEKASVELRSTG